MIVAATLTRRLTRPLLRAGLGSNWGTLPPAQHYTTYNARTFLQPQLNKAVRRDQRATLGDRNPKDYVIFDAEAFRKPPERLLERSWKRQEPK